MFWWYWILFVWAVLVTAWAITVGVAIFIEQVKYRHRHEYRDEYGRKYD